MNMYKHEQQKVSELVNLMINMDKHNVWYTGNLCLYKLQDERSVSLDSASLFGQEFGRTTGEYALNCKNRAIGKMHLRKFLYSIMSVVMVVVPSGSGEMKNSIHAIL